MDEEVLVAEVDEVKEDEEVEEIIILAKNVEAGRPMEVGGKRDHIRPQDLRQAVDPHFQLRPRHLLRLHLHPPHRLALVKVFLEKLLLTKSQIWV